MSGGLPPPAPRTKIIHVVVIAHPDDESMFFLPTIRGLAEEKKTVWLLCLTTGNYDGLGKIREKEMIAAGTLLGIDKTIVQDNPLLQDHPTQRWDKVLVASVIRTALVQHIQENQEFLLITFDKSGVSGHFNHIDTHYGVCQLMIQQRLFKERTKISSKNDDNNEPTLHILESWQLYSESNVIFKYIPLVSWILLAISLCFNVAKTSVMNNNTTTTNSQSTTTTTLVPCDNSKCVKVYRLNNPRLNWKAMATHRSQFVWYRRLFVVFSCYTYYNKLLLISRCEKAPTNPLRKKKNDDAKAA
jgi:N-acetylglucosaminylphosphatidylinositol deacetylase